MIINKENVYKLPKHEQKLVECLLEDLYEINLYGERYLRLDGVPDDPLVNARNNFIETDKLFNILRENNFVYENGIWDWRNGSIGWHIYLFRNLDTFNS